MNPFNDYRKSYLAASFAIAAVYAFALGGDLPFPVRLADAVVYGGLLYLVGFVLWNIFRFAIPTNYVLQHQRILTAGLILLTGLFITGTEAFVLYLLFPARFGSFSFSDSVPARLLVTGLLLLLIRLFYIISCEKGKMSENKPDFANHADTQDVTQTTRSGDLAVESPFPEHAADSSQMSDVLMQDAAATDRRNAVRPADDRIGIRDIAVNSPVDRITVRTGQKIKIIPVEDILYIKADGDYISIRAVGGGTWLKEQTMKHTEDLLPPDRFVRIHRSCIVNIHHISRIERNGEKQQVILHNNEKIKISAARYQTLRQVLGF
jgi:hypothetical protein